MGLNRQELAKLVHFCKKNGVFKCKTPDFEIEIARECLTPRKRTAEEKLESNPANLPAWDNLSQEQKLLWSSSLDNNA